ncbi:MAG: HAD-IC family P-type ATPase, partial [Clostridia bacterium]
GVSATIDGKKTVVAKLDYFKREKTEQEKQWLSSGYTIVGVSADDVFLGAFALSDTVKDGAREVIAGLNAINIKSIMLTGDNEQSALCVSSAVGIDSVKHSLLPEQKLSTINQLKLSNNVCMIGDGINDAPSLAAANCSVTMGAVGSDVALEVADMAIMNDDITKVVGLIKFSRQVIGTIKRNIIIAMCINLIAVVLSFVGVLTPIWGALVHNCSSLLVVASSASLLLVRAPQSTTGKATNDSNSVSK